MVFIALVGVFSRSKQEKEANDEEVSYGLGEHIGLEVVDSVSEELYRDWLDPSGRRVCLGVGSCLVPNLGGLSAICH